MLISNSRVLDLARFIVQTFVLHASIISPLSEAGKLKLVTDTTSLEFSISQFLSSRSLSLATMGDQHKALRAFRPLLFLSDEELGDRAKTVDVPILILIHHLIGRSKLEYPHKKRNWTEGEYVRWLNEHGEEERIKFVEGVLDGVEEEEPIVMTLKTILKRQKES